MSEPVAWGSDEHDPSAVLYVLEIKRGRIKVGFTRSPLARLRRHRALAEAHGCTPGREWTSPPGSGTAWREAALIKFCAELPRSRRFAKEYFAGVPFEVAVCRAAELCDDRLTAHRLRASSTLESA